MRGMSAGRNRVSSRPDLDSPPSDGARFDAFQRECIEVFVRASQILAVPRSIGEIYGLLFASSAPISMDGIVRQLGISKGSASQGLRWLKDAGAVRTTYIPGDRRDHFVAETELRKLAAGFLREQVRPHLDSGGNLLSRLDAAVTDSVNPKFAAGRVKKLRRWHRFGGQVVPLLLRVAEKF